MGLANTVRRRMRAKRVAWLDAHPWDLQALPGEFNDVSAEQSARLVAVGELMVAAGLYSVETTVTERNWSIRRLITEIRKGLRGTA